MRGGTFALDILNLVYNATPITGIGDNAASSPLTSIKLALHSAYPGRSGNQSTSAVAYTNYAQASATRNSSGFEVSSDPTDPTVTLAALTSFPECGATGDVARFFTTGNGTKIFDIGVIGPFLGPFTATAADTITIPGLSGVSTGEMVVFLAVDGSSLPSGITEGTTYYVKTLSGNDITVSATLGGATLDIGAGDGVIYKSTPITIESGVTPQLSASTTIYGG